MKYKIKFTSAFKQGYKLMKKRGADLTALDDVLVQLSNGNPLAPKYHDHELTGNFTGFRECHIKPDWLLIYLVEDDVLTLTLAQTGTHSDLFKK